ncbi:MAG: hypoxanthine phosphoribosyltransferase [bacterium]|nr:hypoxanthine phosphoribosyltransferase [bacterium]
MKILLSADEVQRGVANMAEQIEKRYSDQPLTMLGIMTGSLVLLADLMRLLDHPLRIGVLQASSYDGDSRGELTINVEMMPDIRGRNVILVDDIFDTGHTMQKTIFKLNELKPASIASAVLLEKSGCRQVDVRPDFSAFTIPDKFVVGYGLDYNDIYRNLPYIAALEQADIDTHAGDFDIA